MAQVDDLHFVALMHVIYDKKHTWASYKAGIEFLEMIEDFWKTTSEKIHRILINLSLIIPG